MRPEISANCIHCQKNSNRIPRATDWWHSLQPLPIRFFVFLSLDLVLFLFFRLVGFFLFFIVFRFFYFNCSPEIVMSFTLVRSYETTQTEGFTACKPHSRDLSILNGIFTAISFPTQCNCCDIHTYIFHQSLFASAGRPSRDSSLVLGRG